MKVPSKTGPYDQLILFGDSITEQSASQALGFAFMPALQDVYMRRMDVINRGFSGYNTAHAIKVLPQFMPTTSQASVRIMTIFFGANDACLPVDNPFSQYVPLPVYRENLKKILNHESIKAHAPGIILITPPPIDERAQEIVDASKGSALLRSASNTRKYAEACAEVGKLEGVPVVDFWSEIMKGTHWNPNSKEPLPGSRDLPPDPYLKEVLRDGLHLNPEGYKVLFQAVKRTIEENWPAYRGEDMPFVFPYWLGAPK